MSFLKLAFENLFNLPLLCFFLGAATAPISKRLWIPIKLSQLATAAVLFLIGFKGGGPLFFHFDLKTPLFLILVLAWGFILPFIAYSILRASTDVDKPTACAISASFGSISVMTFIAGATFLERLDIPFEKLILGGLVFMEVPGIITGLFLAKKCGESVSDKRGLLQGALFNKTIIAIFSGLFLGTVFDFFGWHLSSKIVLSSYQPILCLFLFDMGQRAVMHRGKGVWPVSLFGIYMPLIGAAGGLLISYLLQLDIGTGTLLTVLTASASYIAVPAAMRAALPQAKESIYLPLAIGITFPFNVILGIPIYFHMASKILG